MTNAIRGLLRLRHDCVPTWEQDFPSGPGKPLPRLAHPRCAWCGKDMP